MIDKMIGELTGEWFIHRLFSNTGKKITVIWRNYKIYNIVKDKDNNDVFLSNPVHKKQMIDLEDIKVEDLEDIIY